ncbi:hypothetical protein Hdeb2414_s0002g00077591 [Helianthus debilis subsp. tardiflorus]
MMMMTIPAPTDHQRFFLITSPPNSPLCYTTAADHRGAPINLHHAIRCGINC